MVILFDVNGTLLDTAALATPLRRIFGRKLPVNLFFTQLLQYSLATTAVGEYYSFRELAAGTLEMNAAIHGINITSEEIAAVLTRMRRLPAFPDVKPALKRLQDCGHRLATLTNSNTDAANEQLRRSGLTKYFEKTLSVEAVRKYKPSAETYKCAADSLGVEAKDVLMVAVHPWDLFGAAAVGLHTALITRPGHAAFPKLPPPTYTAPDLVNLVNQLLGVAPAPPPRPVLPSNYAFVGTCAIALGMATVLFPAITDKDSRRL